MMTRGDRYEKWKKNATVQPAPFVKPHFVLIVAYATVLLIIGRSVHQGWSGSILMQA